MKNTLRLFGLLLCAFIAIESTAQTLTDVIIPKYIEGNSSTNNNRLPYVFRVTISGLTPNATYRYFNQAVLSSDNTTINGAGNPIFVSGNRFTTHSSPTMTNTNPGTYSTFTTNNNGSYTGWFAMEPTGNTKFTPGNGVFMRIMLNDGNNGTSVVTRLTTTDSAIVLNLTSTTSNGTGLKGSSSATPRNFVFVYDNENGTGRPISGTYVESDSLAAHQTQYAAFYRNDVDTVSGAYGLIIPNTNANGIQRIEQRDFATAAIVGCPATDADGIWPSGANTVNPTGGTTAITITPTDALLDTVSVSLPPFTSPVCSNAAPITLNTGTPSGGVYSGTGVSSGVFDPTVAGVGTFLITYTAGNGNCSAMDTASITVKACSTQTATLTDVIIPKYMQGNNGTNNNRLPYVYRVTLSGLNPNASYRFFNQVVTSADGPTVSGAGNSIYARPNKFLRTTAPGISTNNGSFITDNNGSYTGWFIVEPSSNIRFTPGNYVFMSIMLNNGSGGTTVATRLRTTDSIAVINFGADTDNGTGVEGASAATPRNFIFVYDNVNGTGRPIAGTYVENDSVANTTANSYVAFYNNNVNAVDGAYGLIIPNTNADGIQRIEQRNFATGAIVGCPATDADGVWPSGANTVNPTGGTTAIKITTTDALLDTVSVSLPAFSSLICSNGTPLTVNTGTPAGGVYSGAGVSNDSFDPTVSGQGTFLITYTVGSGNCSSQDTASVTVSVCTGVNENTNGIIMLYPNPTNNEITIAISDAAISELNITLIDLQGKKVYTETVKNINGNYTKQINLEKLAKGVYHTKLIYTDANAKQTIESNKLIIQ